MKKIMARLGLAVVASALAAGPFTAASFAGSFAGDDQVAQRGKPYSVADQAGEAYLIVPGAYK